MDTELLIDVLHVGSHRVLGNAELVRDGKSAAFAKELVEHCTFSLGERSCFHKGVVSFSATFFLLVLKSVFQPASSGNARLGVEVALALGYRSP